MHILDWEKAYLTDNPFVSTPPVSFEEEIVWADMAEYKSTIESILLASLKTTPYTLILNWGPWGSGKTHAAKYFNQKSVLEALSKDAGAPLPLSITITLPKGSKDVVRAIYLMIMGNLLTQFSKALKQVSARLGAEFPELVRFFVKDEEFATAILLLAGKSTRPEQRDFFPQNSEVISLDLRRYFLLSASSSEIKRLGLGRTIENSDDIIRVLTGILNLLLYYSRGTAPEYSEVIIWFDEMEEILSLPGREQYILQSLIRDLTDLVPRNLTMFINFSPAAGEELEDLGVYLSPAVWSRVRHQFFLGMFEESDMIQYINDLLNASQFRPDRLKEQCPDELFPFDLEAIRFLYQELSTRAIPRYVNEVCSLIVEKALAENLFDSPDQRINLEFVQGMEAEIQSITAKGQIQSDRSK
jgi:hypothetical protein